MIDFKDRQVQVGAVVALIVAITILRMIETQTGPLFLIPVALAALWLGRWPGVATGVIASLLTRITIEINGAQPEPTLFAELVRLAVYGGLGYVIGRLSESRLVLGRELLRRQLKLEELHTLQQALAPSRPPERPSLELATCYVPAEQGVSGDFYVVAPARDGATLIAVGDVAGRGLDAAKRAWYVRTLIVSSADLSGDPATVLERANRTLIDETGFGSPFITAACMLYHPDGAVEWALAGHNAPLHLDRGLPLQGEGKPGLPLGIGDSLGCTASEAQLAPGDGLLLYTDGLTEARRSENGSVDDFELFGEARVERLIGDLGPSKPEEVVFSVRRVVHEFSGGRLADDLCMVALRRNSHSRATAL